MSVEAVLDKLDAARQVGPDQWMALCPSHPDHTPSLSISIGDDGKVLLHCFAGCEAKAVRAAAGLSWCDLFEPATNGQAPPRKRPARKPLGPVEARYTYENKGYVPVFRVNRHEGKVFIQERYENGKWIGGPGAMDGVLGLLYNLPAVVKAVEEGRPVYIVEGEKDADALIAARHVATTSPQGARSWALVAEHAVEVLDGAEVIVVADRDSEGHKYAAAVVETLTPVAASVTVMQAAEGKDVSDHLATGRTVEELVPLDLEAALADVVASATEEGDAVEGEPSRVVPGLPEEVWAARPYLAHLRQAALARNRAPEAVLGAALARLAADSDHRIELPPTVGTACGLSLLVALVGPPGVGKSTANGIATELLARRVLDPSADNQPLGSGEGLVELLFAEVTEEDANGKRTKVKRQTRHNAFVYADEGETAAKLGTRADSVLWATVRSIFSSSTLGQANASAERRRVAPSWSYAFGVVMGFQPAVLRSLLDDAAIGTPQRFVYMPANTERPDTRPLPPEGDLPRGVLSSTELNGHEILVGGVNRLRLTLPASVEAEVLAADDRQQREGCAPLDEHRNLLRLKVAGILAVWDGRLDVNEADWWIAGAVVGLSVATRERALDEVRADAARKAEHAKAVKVWTAVASDEAIEDRKVHKAAEWIKRKVRAEPDRWTYSDLRRQAAHLREHFAAGLDLLVGEGFVVEVVEDGRGQDKRSLRPGPRMSRRG